ncbi:SMI1/KNR4 family protein [Streptosporangium carneum]|uniref:SMI1/KNR4 family protein n=1 Tax=Streptosporangium carneum TaxID=47481 RepID=A0A9W6I8B9_9ACTN|nr:SMI1/KNR4 family protein [Streptosporangium carneum]GLK13937.1 hypothetical protein GCM10017600_73490 [Streptosporangium carneum]
MASIADFEAIVGAPTTAAPVVDWNTLEETVGLVFPSDYKDLMNRYSQLSIDRFLGMLIAHPGKRDVRSAKDRVIERLSHLEADDDDSIELLDDEGERSLRTPFPLYPHPNGLYPWGSTQNGDDCLWLTGERPEEWTVVITDGYFWWHFPGSLLEFLVGALSGTVRCPIFPGEGTLEASIQEL